MAESDKVIRGYAFVESVSKPSEDGSTYQRLSLVLDVISTSAFDSDEGGERNPKDLSIIRIMSTLNRLQELFYIGDIAEGTWFYVVFQDSPGNPIAWVLDAADDYSGPIRRTNLIDLQPLLMKLRGSSEPNLFTRLSALCNPAREQAKQAKQNLKSDFITNLPPRDFYVRVVDVGQASFAAIHEAMALNSNIVGYFDVGGPAFFHNKTFPKVFTENTRVPKKGFVALSHWDFDHYSLALTKLKSLQQLTWYAPVQTVGPNAARLQSQLGCNLVLLEQSSFQITQGLDLWRAAIPIPKKDRNASGYVLTVSRHDAKALLTGDMPYNKIPPHVTHNLSALCITHHGGLGGGTPPSPVNRYGIAAVSYGVPNSYHHPNTSNLKNHKNIGWRICPTCLLGDVWL
jgi:hypothetical protein